MSVSCKHCNNWTDYIVLGLCQRCWAARQALETALDRLAPSAQISLLKDARARLHRRLLEQKTMPRRPRKSWQVHTRERGTDKIDSASSQVPTG